MTKETRLAALQRQISRLETRVSLLRQTSNRYAWVRAAIFFGGALISGLALYFGGLGLFVGAAAFFIILFGLSIYYHRKIDASISMREALIQLQMTQIARMKLDWDNIPPLSPRQPRYEHPFEADLDIVGSRSLHHLIDTTVSIEGSRLLANWLTTPRPKLSEIIRRQNLVRELTPLFRFRNRLALNATAAAGTRKIWDARRLLLWLEQDSPEQALYPWLWIFGAMAAANLILLVLNLLDLIPAIWQMTYLLYFGLLLAKSPTTGALFREAVALQGALKQLGAIFRELELFSYRNTSHLRTLCEPFLDQANRPSEYLARMSRMVFAAGLRGNPVMWVILNAFLPWDIFFAWRLSRQRTELAQYAPVWLERWFELEALSALANLAYLNPAYTRPALRDDTLDPVFTAEDLGHPLLPDEVRVCNSFTINRLGELTIITGSNMAGKSTFLRTVGLNLALAYAGGPVNAVRLESILFRLFTCIKVSDSVTDGTSYFYAEVKRLKALLQELGQDDSLPLFLTIDEIFRGTNNRERFIGSKAYVSTLVGKNGVGLISTHDLELARIADETPDITNYHFRDDVRNGHMVFDYRLHTGPCPTTNALKIMEMEGLPVEVAPWTHGDKIFP